MVSNSMLVAIASLIQNTGSQRKPREKVFEESKTENVSSRGNVIIIAEPRSVSPKKEIAALH